MPQAGFPCCAVVLAAQQGASRMPSPLGVSRALCASPRCGVRARRTEVFAIVGKNRDRWRRRSLRRRDRCRQRRRMRGQTQKPFPFFPPHQSLRDSFPPRGSLCNPPLIPPLHRVPTKMQRIFVGFLQGGARRESYQLCRKQGFPAQRDSICRYLGFRGKGSRRVLKCCHKAAAGKTERRAKRTLGFSSPHGNSFCQFKKNFVIPPYTPPPSTPST